MMYRNNLSNPREIIPIVLVALIAPLVLAATHAHAGAAPDPRGAARPDGPSEEVEMPIERVYALCIGIEDYSSDPFLNDLGGAANDADSMDLVFRELYRYETVLLKNGQADREGIERAIKKVIGSAGPRDAIIVYFAGHGHTIQKEQHNFGYIVPHGTDIHASLNHEVTQVLEQRSLPDSFNESGPDSMSSGAALPDEDDTAIEDSLSRGAIRAKLEPETIENPAWIATHYIPIEGIRDRLIESDARHVVMIFDSCFSGVAANMDGFTARGGDDGSDEYARYRWLKRGSRVVLTAGTANQPVYENAYIGNNNYLRRNESHGLFSRVVIEALTDEETLARSTLEMHKQIYTGVGDLTLELGFDEEMDPQHRRFSDQGGDFVFVKNPTEAWIERVRDKVQSRVDSGRRRSKTLSGRGGASHDPGRGGGRRRGPGGRTGAEVQAKAQRMNMQTLAENQAYLDLMVLNQEASLVEQGKKQHDPNAKRWRELVKRNKMLASTGDPVGASVMAFAHNRGIGVADPDPQRARLWAVEARDTGHFEGHAALDMISGMDVDRALEAAKKRANEQSAKSMAGVAALTYAAGTLSGDSDTATILIGVVAGVYVLNNILGNKDPTELVSEMHNAREVYSSAGRAGGRNLDERSEAIRDWAEAAREIEEHAREYEARDTLYATVGPILANRVRTALNMLRRVPNDEVARDNAFRYTDELTAVIVSEFAEKQ